VARFALELEFSDGLFETDERSLSNFAGAREKEQIVGVAEIVQARERTDTPVKALEIVSKEGRPGLDPECECLKPSCSIDSLSFAMLPIKRSH